VVTGLATSFPSLLAGVCLVALVTGGIAPFIASLVASRWGMAQFGRVMGVIHAFAALSGIGPLIAATIRDSTGSYSLAFLALTVLLIPAIACFVTLPRVVEVQPEAEPAVTCVSLRALKIPGTPGFFVASDPTIPICDNRSRYFLPLFLARINIGLYSDIANTNTSLP